MSTLRPLWTAGLTVAYVALLLEGIAESLLVVYVAGVLAPEAAVAVGRRFPLLRGRGA